MSTDSKSSIFDDFIKRLSLFDQIEYRHFISIEPIDDCDIYHYHRPNKCDDIRENSVCTIHYDLLDLRQHPSINHTLDKLDSFKHLVFINKNEYERWEFKYAKKHLINHGYDPLLLLRKEKYPCSKINIGVFSKYYKDGRKGNKYLEKVVSKLPKNKFNFFLIGADWEKCSLNKFGNVKILQPDDYQALIRIYSIINIVFIFSPYEGGPASLPEAISAGCSVISSNCGMANEFIRDDDIITFDIDTDIDLIFKHAASIKKNIKQNFKIIPQEWKEIASRYHDIYGLIK